MKRSFLIFGLSIVMSIFVFNETFAQFYIGPYVGFKSSGLNGATQLTSNGQIYQLGVADAGATGFNAGVAVGYQVIPAEVAGGLYKLDIDLDVSWASFSYMENAWNSVNGAGSFKADGLSGGTTNSISIDVMPIHRFNINNFILSPYAGLGVGVNLLLASDISVGPPSQSGTLTTVNNTKVGLLIFYGTVVNLTYNIKPFIQFKHLIPFGSQTPLTESFQSSQGGGTGSYAISINDVPSYFNLVAGVRFAF